MKRKTKTTEQYIQEAIQVHGNKYDYSKVIYEHSEKKICIVCPKHGEFLQRASSHLSGRGCPKCGTEQGSKLKKKVKLQINLLVMQLKYMEINMIIVRVNILMLTQKLR